MFVVAVVVAVIFSVDLPYRVLIIFGCAATTAALLLALLIFGDSGVHLTRVWRFGQGGVSRELRFPLPARLWPREFPDVIEFEIIHALVTAGLMSRYMQGGHQDTLRFLPRRRGRPITILFRSKTESGARLRGASFATVPTREIEQEILPDVLAVAGVACEKVGVPLYVTEKTFWIGSESDG